jgi:hypothetical protein
MSSNFGPAVYSGLCLTPYHTYMQEFRTGIVQSGFADICGYFSGVRGC